MPLAYLLVQVSDTAYLSRLGKALSLRPGLIEKVKSRVVAVLRDKDNAEEMQDEVLNIFDIDEEQRIVDISDLSKLINRTSLYFRQFYLCLTNIKLLLSIRKWLKIA